MGSEEAVDGKSDVSLAVEGALHALELGQGAEGMLGGLSEGSNDDGLEWSVLTRPLPDAPEEIDAGGP